MTIQTRLLKAVAFDNSIFFLLIVHFLKVSALRSLPLLTHTFHFNTISFNSIVTIVGYILYKITGIIKIKAIGYKNFILLNHMQNPL